MKMKKFRDNEELYDRIQQKNKAKKIKKYRKERRKEK